ncbi:MAG: DNA polymerase III subunit alpha [Muribaculaceae bacterium]|nr:DNA polymerase III subunit alpha [Muribaculaceae bacterium]
MKQPFVHLHVHSQYSLLDGQAPVASLVDKAIADGQGALALTDHGTMYGIKEFFNYTAKKNKATKEAIKKAKAALEEARNANDAEALSMAEKELTEAQKKYLKPILGCEVYVANNSLTDRSDKNDKGRHLILLAKNSVGYHNLIKIVSQAWTEGFYSHPRTDKQAIARHKEGLIVCSACLGGEVPRLLISGNYAEADKAVKWWKDLMGDDYYIELQRHKATVPRANHETYRLQMSIEKQLLELAAKHNVKVLATNDVHFVEEEDAEAHDRLICLSTNKFLADESRMLYSKQEWMKTKSEMYELFADMPEVLATTQEVADKIEEYTIDHAPIMPNFEIPASFGTEEDLRKRLTHEDLFNEFTRDENGNVVLSREEAEKKIANLGGYEKLYRIKFEADYLSKLAYDGAERRYGTPLSEELKERINFELYIMKTMGFPGYFLIVQDFINAARQQLGVSVGPGRGSAAGSCVAYCLGITQIDPIKYDLLFERFLNPDRISLPDIDIDFDDDGRGDVLKYVTHKYGEEKVAHIITYGTMAAKSAIKDVARVEQLPLSESNRLSKLVPGRMPEVNGKALKQNLKNCYEYVDAFKVELSNPDPIVRETLKYAKALEGNVRNVGVHACGVIICRDDITDWVPVSTATDKEEGKLLVTQYEGSIIEETGLIKMDFLGLKTLSILKDAVHNIKLNKGIDIDLDNIPLDDKKTYELFTEGRTIGTFQFESAGMQKYLKELKPSKFEDLIAMNALYRPGPMDYIPDFIKRKHGESPIVYDIPEMEKYLKDTYGITVYQEQVMLLSRLLANFTRGESDTLRKAMGKKLIDKMNALKAKFLAGGQANGHNQQVLEKIWADWEKFASYAFNKSHATCYSWIAFQTAYLKAHYPSEYMAAVLSRNLNDLTKLTFFMDECRAMRIAVLGPDVNESFSKFGVNSRGDIRFGLSAIKGVGKNVVDAIVKARSSEPFKDIYDFVERVPTGVLNRRTFEALALSGAFDCFEGTKREDFFAVNSRDESMAEILLRYGNNYQAHSRNNEASLFDFDDSIDLTKDARPPIKPAVQWAAPDRLAKEKEYVGMYLSEHPLDPYYMELTYGTTARLSEIDELEPVEGAEVVFGGMVTSYETKLSKNNNRYGVMRIEDISGSYDVRLFGDNVFKFGNYGIPGTPVLITCEFKRRFKSTDISLEVKNIQPLEHIKGKLIKSLTLNVSSKEADNRLQSLLEEHLVSENSDANDELSSSGLNINLYDPTFNRSVLLTSSIKINLSRKFIEMLEENEIEFNVETYTA